jgi:putative DNA primase/helicase
MYPEKYLELVPEKERYNIFVTFAKCHEGPGRRLQEQNVIPFDIDRIDYAFMDQYIEIFCRVLNVPRYEVGIIATGNGLHILVGINLPILDEEFFNINATYYKAVCMKVAKAFDEAQLPYKDVDPQVFNQGFMTRLPGTENIKEIEGQKVVKPVTVVNAILTYGDFDLREASGMIAPKSHEVVSKEHLKEMFKKGNQTYADNEAVLNDCPFMVYAKTSKDLTERQWYNALNIASHLREGYKVCHEISKHDPRYSFPETQMKAENAYQHSGPFTCETIAKNFDACGTCPHYGKISSPISLKTDDFIATEASHFRFLSEDGKAGRIDFDGLVRFYKRSKKVISLGKNIYYEFNGKFWQELDADVLASYALKSIRPLPRVSDCNEFVDMMRITSKVPDSYFEKTTNGFMNFNNGVLDLKTWSLVPHDSKYGFTSIINFDYDPEAKSPLWEKVVAKVLPNKEESQKVMQEFFGYCLSGSKVVYHKALLMNGEGSNGKSTVMDTLKYLIDQNYSSLPWSSVVQSDKNFLMTYKLVNISEEVGKKDFINCTNVMKQLIAGGEYQTRKLYCNPITVKNKTKFILACNKLPSTDDTSYGFIRRMLIINFDAKIDRTTDPDFDPRIQEKLNEEAPGILNWCIAGYKRLVEQDSFTESDAISRALDEYQEENNPLIGFVAECVSTGSGLQEGFQHLYSGYSLYCRDTGVKALKKTTFIREFERHCGKNKLTLKRKMYRIYGSNHPVNCFTGVCLISNLDKQADHF